MAKPKDQPQAVPLDMDELIRMLGSKDVEILQLRCALKRQAPVMEPTNGHVTKDEVAAGES